MQLCKSIKISFLAFVFFGLSAQGMSHLRVLPRYHQPSQAEELGKAALVIGCIAAVGYGFYKLCDWLFTKTDIQVLQEGQAALKDAEQMSRPYLDFFEHNVGNLLDAAVNREIMYALNEGLLYKFAVAHAFRTSLEHSILNSLFAARSNAKAAHSMVLERIHTLRKKNDHTGMIAQLEAVQHQLQDAITRINFVYEYLHQHRSYYALLLNEYSVMKQHEYELSAFAQYAQNPVMLREILRVAVMRQATSQMTYPYMNYIQKMQSVIQQLDHQINSLSCNYPERRSAAHSLLTNLNAMYNMLIIEDAYRQELRDYERAQLEKQRIEAEQAKAAAAQAAAHAAQVQANAMQAQAWELQKQNQLYAQQNQLQAQQNRIEQDRNVILTAQTIVDVVNPRQVHVYN